MRVTTENLLKVQETLLRENKLSIDTETTGLDLFHGDSIFAVSISTMGRSVFYFDSRVLGGWDAIRKVLSPLAENQAILWIGHNIKFDYTALYRAGLKLRGDLYCTQALARVQDNTHMKYGLDACAKRLGLNKSDAVEEYISAHGLWQWETRWGKRKKKKFFDRVPMDIMQEYAEKDALLVWDIYEDQQRTFILWNSGPRPIRSLVDNEIKLTKVCAEMGITGFPVDVVFCEKGLQHEVAEYKKAAACFTDISKVDFLDSNKMLAEAFQRLGVRPGLTEKGNPSFTDDELSKINHPLAECVRTYREHYKRGHTYFEGLLHYADRNGVIHMDLRQDGTATGRLSCREPNLQNLSEKKDQKGAYEYSVRRALKPFPGECLVSMDLQAAEYRLLIDYAGETVLAEKVKSGHDLHDATKDVIGLEGENSRDQAKTIGFGLLYGQGAAALAASLKVALTEASRLKNKYLSALPRIRMFMDKVKYRATRQGVLINFLGRRLRFPNRDYVYKGVNHLIQGGVGDIIKLAMVQVATEIEEKNLKTKLIASIHDELVFSIPKEEFNHIPRWVQIMESVYPYKYLPMKASVCFSWESLADMEEGTPQ